MLDTYGNQEIQFPAPLETSDLGVVKKKMGTLAEAVQIWLHRMDLAAAVGTAETSKVGFHLTVKQGELDRALDLTSVGVGVSQVMPILVMSLLAPDGSILIFEQPEVHMHPKVQSVLGDFFLGMAACGKQCIVETHSEHLINRLRRRIAEAPGVETLEQIRIYFVERQQSISVFQAVEPNEFGAISEWPTGFFDEAEDESSAIMRVALAKQRAAWDREKTKTGKGE